MIIDCFTFWKELDLLEIRLNELYKSVDKFILVEASRTQSLIEKPFYFEENKERYSKFLDKIIHVKVDDYPSNDSNLWNMENFQRNCISLGLEKINLSDNDTILISDLDEIPNSSIIEKLNNHSFECLSFDMMFSAYFFNLVALNRSWVGTVAVKYSLYKQYNAQFFRNIKDNSPRLKNSGWHLSWCGGYTQIYEKAHSCIEPFDKTTLPSIEEFRKYFDNFIKNDKKFFIHLENLCKQETEFTKINLDKSFPQFIYNNIEKFSKYIL